MTSAAQPHWRSSSKADNGGRVEALIDKATVRIRAVWPFAGQEAYGASITVRREEWDAFIEAAKAGEFDE